MEMVTLSVYFDVETIVRRNHAYLGLPMWKINLRISNNLYQRMKSSLMLKQSHTKNFTPKRILQANCTETALRG